MVKRRIQIVHPAEGEEQHQAVIANGHDIPDTVRAAQSKRLLDANTRHGRRATITPFPSAGNSVLLIMLPTASQKVSHFW